MSKETTSCKVIADSNDWITDWVCRNLHIGTDWLGKHFTIGFIYQNRLIGGLIYHDCRYGTDVWWTLYTTDKHWCTRAVLRFMFSVAFDYYKCKRISIMTSVNNIQCQKLALGLGFMVEGILKNYADDGSDTIIMGLQKQQTRF